MLIRNWLRGLLRHVGIATPCGLCRRSVDASFRARKGSRFPQQTEALEARVLLTGAEFAFTSDIAPTYSVGGAPHDLIAADLDGDGHADLISANRSADSISVLFNQGDGTFSAAINYGVGLSPTSVRAADLDLDGDLDLITADAESNTISFLRNTGNGTFLPATSTPAGSSLVSLTLADVDSDGLMDVVTLQSVPSSVLILRNLGDGVFGSRASYTIGGSPSSIFSGDFDADGDVDLATTIRSNGAVSVLLNVGNGTFEDDVEYGVGQLPYSVVAGDFDGDGHVDLMALHDGSGLPRVIMLKNNGDGTFAEMPPSFAPDGSRELTAADLDLDGDLDLIVTNQTTSMISILRNPGNGIFTLEQECYAVGDSLSVAVDDFDGDGLVDIAVGNTVGTVSILINEGDSGFAAQPVLIGGSSTMLADVDGDGQIDVITADGANIFVMRQTDDRAFAYARTIRAISPIRSMQAGDFNVDGLIDLVVATTDSRFVSVHFGMGDGAFQSGVNYPMESRINAITVDDFNNDGILDFATTTVDTNAIVVMLNQGDGVFLRQTAIPVNDFPIGIKSADVDRDGDIDLVFALSTFDSVLILLNDGEGAFSASDSYSVFVDANTRPGGLVIGDFDGVNGVDIAVANRSTSALSRKTVSVLLNNGAGQFLPQILYDVPDSPNAIVAADLDEDGDVDLAVASETARSLAFLQNQGSGTFILRDQVDLANRPTQLLASDVDRDGRVDLVVSNLGEGTTAVLFQRGPMTTERPDLAIDTLEVTPAEIQFGKTFQVTYSVRNLGTGPVLDDWIDTIYLSHDDQWDPSDVVLQRVFRTDALGAGAADMRSLSVSVPAVEGFQSGDWHILVRTDSGADIDETDESNQVAAVEVAFELAITPLALNDPFTDDLSVKEQRYFRIDYVAGQRLNISLQDIPMDGVVELYAGRNGIPTPANHDFAVKVPFANEQFLTVPPQTASGTLFLTVFARSLKTPATPFKLLVDSSDYVVLTRNFGVGGNTGDYTIRALGVGIGQTTSVHLLNSGAVIRSAHALYGTRSGELSATFDLRGVAPGSYDVVFTKEAGNELKVTGGLTVVNAAAQDVIASLIAPGAIRRGGEFSFTIELINRSQNDVFAPLITVGNTVPFGLERGDYLLGTQYTFLGINTQGGPVGILRPGQRETLTFWAYSDAAAGDYTVTVGRELKDPHALFDWEPLRERLIPMGFSDAQFAPVFDQMKTTVGLTNQDVLATLSRNATLLSRDLYDIRNLNELLSLEVTRALAATTTSITGKLISNDPSLSLSGLTVELRAGEFVGSYITETLTDGTFIVPNLPPGPYLIEVTGLLVDPLTSQITVANGQHLMGSEVDVSKGEMITGRTISEGDIPVVGASIQILSANHQPVFVTTDSSGVFTASGLNPGDYTVIVDATGFARFVLVGVSSSGIGMDLGDLSLTPGLAVQGSVRNFDGTPLTSGTVNLHRVGEESLVGHSSSISNGMFSFDHIPTGQYSLVVLVEDVVRTQISNVSVNGTNTPVQIGEITLANNGSLQGVVSLPEGQFDFTGFRVGVSAGEEILVAADVSPDGSFSLPSVPAGDLTLRLYAFPVGVFYAEVAISLTPGENQTDIQLNAERGATISGRVFNPIESLPLSAVSLSLFNEQGSRSTVVTDVNGNFTFDNLIPGTYVLSLPGSGSAGTRTIEVSGFGQTLTSQDLNVPIVAKLNSQVLIDGNPVANASVSLFLEESLVGEALTDTMGAVAFLLRQTGVYSLRVAAPNGTFSPVTAIAVTSGSDVAVVVQSGTASLNLQIQSQDGAPVPNADVTLHLPTSTLFGVTDSNGSVQFDHLVAGDYLVRAVAQDGSVNETEVSVGANSPVSSIISLHQGLRISGVLVDQAGQPVADGIVEVIDSTEAAVVLVGITSADGSFTITGVPAGTYDLAAYGSGLQRTTVAGVNIASDATINLTISSAATLVSGRLVNQGLPLAEGTITVIDANGLLLGSQDVAPDGTFQVEAISGQPISILIYSPGMSVAGAEIAGLAEGLNPLGDFELNSVSIVHSNSTGFLTDSVVETFAMTLPGVADTGSSQKFMVAAASSGFLGGLQQWLFDFLDWISTPEQSREHTAMPAPISDPCKLKQYGDLFVKLVRAVGAQDLAFREAENSSRQFTGIAGELGARNIKLAADGIAAAATLASLSPSISGMAIGAPIAFGYTGVSLVVGQAALSIARLMVDVQNAVNSFSGINTPADSVAVGQQAAGAALTLFSSTVDTITELETAKEKDYIALLKQYNATVEPVEKGKIAQAIGRLQSFAKVASGLLGGVSFIADYISEISNGLISLGEQLERVSDQYDRDYGKYERAARKAQALSNKLNAALATPCDEEGEEDDKRKIERPASFDPNDIIGPAAFGPQNHLAPPTVMPYTIRFENDAENATAPAASVVITQTLDLDLDWTTFRLGDIGFGNTVIDVPDDVAYFETRVDLTATRGVFVDVKAGINVATGEVVWEFTAVDPATNDLPVDPFVGFLPPNVTGPEGEGFVNYTVHPKLSVVTADRIDAFASIVFDVNEPILTPAIFHTMDTGTPTSQVLPLPAVTTALTFTVTWTGTDDAGGAGISTYDVFVSENGGPFTLLLDDTLQTSYQFTGVADHGYAFYSVASDLVGFQEAAPASADTQTTVTITNNLPPQLQLGTAAVAWGKGQPPVLLLPDITVSGEELAGGLLTISISAVGSKRKAKDLFRSGAFTGLGTSAGQVYANGTSRLEIQLNNAATAAGIQAFLRSLTFSTKGKGLRVPTRLLTVSLSDTTDQSSSISRTIQVTPKTSKRIGRTAEHSRERAPTRRG